MARLPGNNGRELLLPPLPKWGEGGEDMSPSAPLDQDRRIIKDWVTSAIEPLPAAAIVNRPLTMNRPNGWSELSRES